MQIALNYVRLLLLAASLAYAQQVVAPTPEAVGPTEGRTVGNYNIVQSWELGYRFSEVGGDVAVYRSDVNYGNGIRLLGSNLTVHSKDGKGKLFDEVVLNTQGLGNDPYESATLRVRKNRWYRYDMMWRSNDYYNPGLVTSNGEHFMNTTRRWQDHEFTLFPESNFRVRAGYGRNAESGPALSTVQLFDNQGEVFPLFTNVRRESNQYRIGGDFAFRKFRITALRRWEFYKEDTPYQLAGSGAGAGPTGNDTLSSFNRSEPFRGTNPAWLVNLFGEAGKFAINGRFTYAGGSGDFILDETAIGTNRFGTNQNRETLVSGAARRPSTAADLSLTYVATDNLSIVNNTSFYNSHIDGNNFFQQFDFATSSNSLLNFQYLGFRLITNATDARIQFSKKLSAYGGYQYSDRLIRSNESAALPGQPYQSLIAEQTNRLHTGVAGLNWTLLPTLRLHVEGEIGRADRPFYPISERNYHAISARLQHSSKNFQFSSGYQQRYNNNSISITAYSSRSRNFFADGSWMTTSWFSIDSAYSHLHLDTLGGIAYFVAIPSPTFIQNQTSVYISNIHSANLGAHFSLLKIADLYLGYSITRDTGDGRAAAGTDFLTAVQTFPLTFQSPLARLSIRLHQNLRWNVGYEYYGYKEDFGLIGIQSGYRANTGYTSLLWSF